MLSTDAVCASAPGKLILFGEHAVVYAQPAVAAALSDLRIQVRLEPRGMEEDDGKIHMLMPDLPEPIDCQVSAQELLDLKEQLQAPPAASCTTLLERLARQHSITDEYTVHAILPVLYLISQLCPASIALEGFRVNVRSQDLPVGAGLGSSAAFGVASAAALFQWKLNAGSVSTATTPSKEIVQEINRYAYYSEILLHGRPSGIDNTCSAHGGALLFTRTHHETSLEPMVFSKPLNIILVYTHVPRQTKKLVAQVRKLYDQHPTVITPILEAMGKIATSFCHHVATTTATTTTTSMRSSSSSSSSSRANAF